MRPLRTVRKKSFRVMFRSCVPHLEIKFPTEKSLAIDLNEKAANMLINLKKILAQKEFVCTTADVWTSRAVSYLGMTVHFIDGELRNQTYVLCF